jgi:methylenetetrahydrofolate dehydrogenase (NADP+)/methenyltetrahydrofolate cyclohydrolase
MTAKRIDGKQIALEIQEKIKKEVESLKKKGVIPGLAVVLVGENPASKAYVRNKSRQCHNVGMHSEVIQLPESTSQEALLDTIATLNANPNIHGILVQLPLPSHLSEGSVIQAINPSKDIDGFHPINVGNMVVGQESFLPCTPCGIMELIRHTGTEIAGKHAVVIGRSNIVGKPIAHLLLRENATVTMCHSRTEGLEDITKQADILVVAVGRPFMIDERHIRPGAVVIDVGINRLEDGRLVGDVDFDAAQQVAGHITPVPGGVGPMTIAMLLNNTLESAKRTLS